jgi:phosphate-selective porin OprO/OprP
MLKPLRALCMVVGFIPALALAQDDANELSELRARLEALEAQNQRLERLLELSPNSTSAIPAGWEADSLLPNPQPPAPEPSEVPGHSDQLQYFQAPAACDDDLSMTASWNNGLELITKDKAFRVHVGGRTQFDATWYDADSDVQRNINVPYGDGVDFRRARLRIDGTMYDFIEWAAEYDFANGVRTRNAAGTGTTDFAATGFTDVWWTFTKLPGVGNIRVGNHKEPIGFEHLVSSRWLPFMERSFNQDTFYGMFNNGFTPGISAFNNYADESGFWHIGLYKPNDNFFGASNNTGDYAVTGRATFLPLYFGEDSQLIHVGASARLASAYNDRARLRSREALRSGLFSTWPIPADTGDFFADDQNFVNFELVGVSGPWTFQAELLQSYVTDARRTVRGPELGTANYQGGYVQVLYYLTGESDYDHYNRKTAVFERIIPDENLLVKRDEGITGIGAWQIGARYNCLDLNDEGINGGELDNVTLGLNWFLNPNMKIQFNYIATDRDAPLVAGRGDGWIHGYGMRFAQDF